MIVILALTLFMAWKWRHNRLRDRNDQFITNSGETPHPSSSAPVYLFFSYILYHKLLNYNKSWCNILPRADNQYWSPQRKGLLAKVVDPQPEAHPQPSFGWSKMTMVDVEEVSLQPPAPHGETQVVGLKRRTTIWRVLPVTKVQAVCLSIRVRDPPTILTLLNDAIINQSIPELREK